VFIGVHSWFNPKPPTAKGAFGGFTYVPEGTAISPFRQKAHALSCYFDFSQYFFTLFPATT
jgi:hypothetical protein